MSDTPPVQRVTVSVLLRRLAEAGVRLTDETIRTYATRHGMPCATGAGGARLYDPAEVLAWITANKPAALRAPGEGGLGGRRAGAGRKRRDPIAAQTGTLASVERNAAAAAALNALNAANPPPERAASARGGDHAEPVVAAEQWLRDALRPVKLDDSGKPIDGSGLTRVEAERIQAVIDTARKQADLDERLGKVLPREDVIEAWADILNAFRLHVEGAAADLQSRIASAIGLSAVQSARVREEADAWARGVLERIADDPFAQNRPAAPRRTAA